MCGKRTEGQLKRNWTVINCPQPV